MVPVNGMKSTVTWPLGCVPRRQVLGKQEEVIAVKPHHDLWQQGILKSPAIPLSASLLPQAFPELLPCASEGPPARSLRFLEVTAFCIRNQNT